VSILHRFRDTASYLLKISMIFLNPTCI